MLDRSVKWCVRFLSRSGGHSGFSRRVGADFTLDCGVCFMTGRADGGDWLRMTYHACGRDFSSVFVYI